MRLSPEISDLIECAQAALRNTTDELSHDVVQKFAKIATREHRRWLTLKWKKFLANPTAHHDNLDYREVSWYIRNAVAENEWEDIASNIVTTLLNQPGG